MYFAFGNREHRLDQVLDPLAAFDLRQTGELVLAKSRVQAIRSRNSKGSRGQQFLDQHDLAALPCRQQRSP